MTNPIQDEWQSDDGSVRLLLGDCLEILPTLEAGSIGAVVTDPPYPTWYTEEYHFNEQTTAVVLQMTWPILISFWTPGEPFPTTWDSCHAWDKVVGTNTQFELIYLRGIKEGHRILRNYMTPHSSVRAQICKDVVTEHKSQKPLRLMTELCNKVTGSVLDPFMGSGTTGVACIRTERRFIGIEIERKYFDIAVERCKRELERFPLFENPKPKQLELI